MKFKIFPTPLEISDAVLHALAVGDERLTTDDRHTILVLALFLDNTMKLLPHATVVELMLATTDQVKPALEKLLGILDEIEAKKGEPK